MTAKIYQYPLVSHQISEVEFVSVCELTLPGLKPGLCPWEDLLGNQGECPPAFLTLRIFPFSRNGGQWAIMATSSCTSKVVHGACGKQMHLVQQMHFVHFWWTCWKDMTSFLQWWHGQKPAPWTCRWRHRFLLTILMTGYLKERKRLAESEQATLAAEAAGANPWAIYLSVWARLCGPNCGAHEVQLTRNDNNSIVLMQHMWIL